jgi:hypothetical protein
MTDWLQVVKELTTPPLTQLHGRPGILTAEQLPDGWVCIAHQLYCYSDITADWNGPVIGETETHITIDVYAELMTFLKSELFSITRASA